MSKVIVLDPGHGGTDRYNGGVNGYVEADGVLEMAFAFEEVLKDYDCTVILTRTEDVYMGLKDRPRVAINNDADIFVSLHTNAGGGTGPEVYYSIDLPNDKPIAAKISESIALEFGLKDRGAKYRESTNYPGEDYLTVIDYAQDNGIPHIFLLEPMFHDNINEEAMLQRSDTMSRIAKVVVPVLAEELEIEKKDNGSLEALTKRVVAIEEALKTLGETF